MNGRVAKRLRRAVYGPDGSPRHRKYRTIDGAPVGLSFRVIQSQILADRDRQNYQHLKKNWVQRAKR